MQININTSFSQTSFLAILCVVFIEQHYFVQFFLPKLSFQKGLLDFQIDTKLTRGDMLLNQEPTLCNFLTADIHWGVGIVYGGTVLILVSDEISSL